jgi:hypothetical protein
MTASIQDNSKIYPERPRSPRLPAAYDPCGGTQPRGVLPGLFGGVVPIGILTLRASV